MPIQCYHVILGCFLLKWAGFGELLGWKSSPDLATLVRTHSHSRIVNLQQLQIFSMPNIFPQIASLIIHTAWLSLAWTSTDLPPLSGICQRFIITCRRVKIIGLKSCSVNLALDRLVIVKHQKTTLKINDLWAFNTNCRFIWRLLWVLDVFSQIILIVLMMRDWWASRINMLMMMWRVNTELLIYSNSAIYI